MIDDLVYQAIFSPNEKVQKQSRTQIRKMAQKTSIYLASIHRLYQAFGQGKIIGFTIPAINIRTLTYDTARTIFKVMIKKNIGPVIFEIARSEIGYTDQQPDEYAVAILAAAVKENYRGPVFIQGDHYQFKAKTFKEDAATEIEKIKTLVKKSIDAGFYNIDIDASTLVDLNKTSLDDQQKNNYQMTAMMTKYIRSLEPKGVNISVGGEIGHIGGKNSTPKEFEVFMKGYLKEAQSSKFPSARAQDEGKVQSKKIQGISKVSVQTGTSHGGIPLPDGTIAKVSLDFNVLKSISQVAQEKYSIGGAVQHGASTLPNKLFDQFPKNNALEIHLATGFQNIVYENLPISLKQEIYQWIKKNFKDEWKEGQTEDQFIYKIRKKALGPFKQDLWQMDKSFKQTIMKNLKKQFLFLFEQLKVINTRSVLDQYV